MTASGSVQWRIINFFARCLAGMKSGKSRGNRVWQYVAATRRAHEKEQGYLAGRTCSKRKTPQVGGPGIIRYRIISHLPANGRTRRQCNEAGWEYTRPLWVIISSYVGRVCRREYH